MIVVNLRVGEWQKGFYEMVFIFSCSFMSKKSAILPILCSLLLYSGFVEFWNSEACEKAATLNGKNFLGRNLRLDWSD